MKTYQLVTELNEKGSFFLDVRTSNVWFDVFKRHVDLSL